MTEQVLPRPIPHHVTEKNPTSHISRCSVTTATGTVLPLAGPEYHCCQESRSHTSEHVCSACGYRWAYGPSGGWECRFGVNPQLMEDEPVYRMAVQMQYQLAETRAAEQGYELDGHWLLDTYPLVWVDNWGDGGGWVSPDIAREYCNVNDAPRWIEHVARCGARKVIT